MKKLAIISLLLIGCNNQIPHKVFKTPSAYGFDVIIPLQWDGKQPIETWTQEFELGKEYQGFNSKFTIKEVRPGVVSISTNIVDR